MSLWHWCFPVNFVKFLRTLFLTEHLWTTGVPQNWRSLRPATLFKKETLEQVFFSEFCEISKNTFSYRIPPVAAFAAVMNNFMKLLGKRFVVWFVCDSLNYVYSPLYIESTVCNFLQTGVLENFAIFTGKRCVGVFFQ